MKKSEKVIGEALADMLEILSYKARHGALCEDDIRTIMAVIKVGGGVKATVKELAGFYGQSEDNVRHALHRGWMPSPERKVYYDFDAFRQIMPEKWHHMHSLPAD